MLIYWAAQKIGEKLLAIIFWLAGTHEDSQEPKSSKGNVKTTAGEDIIRKINLQYCL